MRIWSLNPKYLDTKGLVALWRETLLAKNVLEGKTKGYKNHPQLNRFKVVDEPVDAINQYLSEIFNEAVNRGYHFDKEKINWKFNLVKLSVTKGQMEYEAIHLLKKLQRRDIKKYNELKDLKVFKSHPIFKIIKGKIADWEIQST